MKKEKGIVFTGKVKVEVIKKKDKKLFLAKRKLNTIQEKIDFLNEELENQKNEYNMILDEIKKLEKEGE